MSALPRPVHAGPVEATAVGNVLVQAWGRYAGFADPDGNTWTLQQRPPRD